jgi:ribosomal protein S18 acetylase RimI-like enzyme
LRCISQLRIKPDEAIIVGVSKAQVLGLGHCGLQRTPMLPFPGEFFCVYVAPEAQRHGVGTALMLEMVRFLVSRRIGAASLWVARDNVPARRFYDRLGGVVWAERQEARPDFVLPEVAHAWCDLSIILALQS